MSDRYAPGQSFIYKGAELYNASCKTGGCSIGTTKCAMSTEDGCIAVGALKAPSCEGVIFVTRQQYLELKLLGETR